MRQLLDYPRSIVVVHDEFESDLFTLISFLQQDFSPLGVQALQASLSSEFDYSGKVCVVLNQTADTPLLDRSSLGRFERVKRVLTTANKVFWVTRRAHEAKLEPVGSPITGLARTVGSEIGETVIMLDVQRASTLKDTSPDLVRIFRLVYDPINREALEVEFAVKDGCIMVPRIVENVQLDTMSSSIDRPPVPTDGTFADAGRSLVLGIDIPGLLDTIHFVEDPNFVAGSELPSDYVQIEVHATGVNFIDIMASIGKVPQHDMGCECASVITHVGNLVETLKKGDMVASIGMNAASNLVRRPASLTQKLPDRMSFAIGAFTTHCLHYCSVLCQARMFRRMT